MSLILDIIVDELAYHIKSVPNDHLANLVKCVVSDESALKKPYYFAVNNFFLCENYTMDNYTKSLFLPLAYAKLNISGFDEIGKFL